MEHLHKPGKRKKHKLNTIKQYSSTTSSISHSPHNILQREPHMMCLGGVLLGFEPGLLGSGV